MADGKDTGAKNPMPKKVDNIPSSGPANRTPLRGPFGAFDPSLLDSLLSDSDEAGTYSDYDHSHESINTQPDDCACGQFDPATRESDTCYDTIDGRSCELHIIADPGFKGSFKTWMDTISIMCTINGREIGHGLVRFIRRDKIRANFWDVSREARHLLFNFPRTLCDRFGRLRVEQKSHPVKKGTGIWSSEFDTGDILLIDHFHVDAPWMQKALPSLLLKHIRQSVYYSESLPGALSTILQSFSLKTHGLEIKPVPARNPMFEIIIPGFAYNKKDLEGLDTEQIEDYHKESEIAALEFVRDNGFRRIGLSNWFAFTNDATHPSRHLESSLDIDFPQPPDIEEETQAQAAHRLATLRQQSPLHHATMALSDTECLTLFRTKYAPDSPYWERIDDLKDNNLHHAAIGTKPRSVRWIMQNVDPNLHLSSQLNVSNHTPLSLLEWMCENDRSGWGVSDKSGVQTPLIHDKFTGFSETIAQVFAALHGFDPLLPSQVRRFKYGCTCLECIGGIISPQSRLVLLSHTKDIREKVLVGTENGTDWLKLHEMYLEHVGPIIRQKMESDQNLRQGFADLFDQISACLTQKVLPTTSSIKNIIKTSHAQRARNYLRRGGNVEDASRVIFEVAKTHCALAGDGTGLLLYGTALKDLPSCRNDGEYACAALACGIENL